MLQNELISRYAGELFELLAPVKVTGSLKINLISWPLTALVRALVELNFY